MRHYLKTLEIIHDKKLNRSHPVRKIMDNYWRINTTSFTIEESMNKSMHSLKEEIDDKIPKVRILEKLVNITPNMPKNWIDEVTRICNSNDQRICHVSLTIHNSTYYWWGTANNESTVTHPVTSNELTYMTLFQ